MAAVLPKIATVFCSLFVFLATDTTSALEDTKVSDNKTIEIDNDESIITNVNANVTSKKNNDAFDLILNLNSKPKEKKKKKTKSKKASSSKKKHHHNIYSLNSNQSNNNFNQSNKFKVAF